MPIDEAWREIFVGHIDDATRLFMRNRWRDLRDTSSLDR
jgi:hypothetical protein